MRNSNSKIYEIDRSNTFLYANESAQFWNILLFSKFYSNLLYVINLFYFIRILDKNLYVLKSNLLWKIYRNLFK